MFGETKKEQRKLTYEKWWLGKMCRSAYSPESEFQRCVEIKVYGPDSFVFGEVELFFSDGSKLDVYKINKYRPTKRDVEVLDE